jgi:putative transposase
MNNKGNDTYSLSHTSWKCQYHIVFAPKYRRKAIYGNLRADIGAILRELCERKHVNIIEAHAMPDHIHMLVEIPPNQRVSDFMGYLKGKSSVLIYEKFGELKFKYRNREFWCRGYYVDTVGKNTKAIAEYIKHQLDEDKMGEQLTMLGKSSDNPFTGGK